MREKNSLSHQAPVSSVKIGGNEARRIALDYNQISAWFREGKTAAEIAITVGCSTHPIKKALCRLGLKRPAKRRVGIGAGASNPSWKGGRRLRSDGYIAIWTANGERLEHQVVMEGILGRPLQPGEIVHHRDECKSNNEPNNLMLMTQSEHIREHLPKMHAARYGK